ncbi:hypothetical protein C2142_33560 [Streptomyces sp. CB01881]|nr:hypothetical protein C2142_33560 [Streptomyces sp. CB01881]
MAVRAVARPRAPPGPAGERRSGRRTVGLRSGGARARPAGSRCRVAYVCRVAGSDGESGRQFARGHGNFHGGVRGNFYESKSG